MIEPRGWMVVLLIAGCGGRPEPDPPGATAREATGRRAFEREGLRLVVEAEGERLHVELARAEGPFDPDRAIATTPMVVPGGGPPGHWRGDRLVAGEVTVAVSADLCLEVERAGAKVGLFCPALEAGGGRLRMASEPGAQAFGLGQKCVAPGGPVDWSGLAREPGGEYGNRMVEFDGGACGDTQIPILYAVGERARFALFVDEVRALRWDLRAIPWSVATPGAALRFYLATGPDLAALRAAYLELTGRPPVPPRAAFGLWVSEYGYDDWAEVDGVLAGLRKHGFPLDGVVLDLQWFGGIREGRDDTSMGRLTFDERRFPDPASKIAALARDGVGVIPIEESYVGRALPEHAALAARGALATAAGAPVYLTANPWWGKGGMIDWSDPAAADHWHDWKRRPLIEMGVVGHWTDLGEPELYDARAIYHGFAGIGRDHAAVHNLYNFAWADSIARGYRRQGSARRPFVLSRSGTAGIQRFGVAMWSGDLGSRFTTLAAQQRNAVHMAMSGVDYYGSDVGGFKREAIGGGDVDDLYTRWFAAAALTEVPLRPHTYNLDEKYETSPDRIGDRAANLAHLRLRYQLVPTLYALAHRAHRRGEAVFPPLALVFPDDSRARAIADQRMIGRDLMVAISATAGERSRRVYLPADHWFDYRSGELLLSNGRWLDDAPLYRDGVLALPIYARAGAIVPLARVDDATRGAAADGRELRLRVFPPLAHRRGSFEVVEDDGATTGYLRGEVRTTGVTTVITGRRLVIDVGPARGGYPGAPDRRNLVLEVVGSTKTMTVTVDGVALSYGAGWRLDGRHWLTIDAGTAPVTRARRIEIEHDVR